MENLREGLLLGIGNPLLDISVIVDDDLLQKYGLKPNDAVMANESQMPLYKELMARPGVEYIAGGSVQNTMRVAQWILKKPRVTTYFGCVGKDEFAKILRDKATQDGVNVRYQYTTEQPTGTCGVLITGTHRSLCANLAAATQFTDKHLREEENARAIDAAQYFYASGFFLASSPESVMALARHAHSHQHMFIMNLSAPFVSTLYTEQLREALAYVDILFGNETEAQAFSEEFKLNLKDNEKIALAICNMPKKNEQKKRVVVITQGRHPVILAREGKVTKIPVAELSPEQIVDTNGAGDAFCGGFLAQLIQKQPLETCVRCGIYAATHIIQKSGCTFNGVSEFKA